MSDTDHFRGALAQWNAERLADGLPALTTDDLTMPQLSNVLRLAQQLKNAVENHPVPTITDPETGRSYPIEVLLQ